MGQLLDAAAAVDMNGINEGQTAQDNALTANLPNGHLSVMQRLAKAAKESQSEYLYLIASEKTGLFKIGYTCHPAQRLKELQRDSAFPLKMFALFEVPFASGAVFERAFHCAFADCRTHGEWFLLSPDDLVFFTGDPNPFWIPMARLTWELP